jgi:hypothetical protein
VLESPELTDTYKVCCSPNVIEQTGISYDTKDKKMKIDLPETAPGKKFDGRYGILFTGSLDN